MPQQHKYESSHLRLKAIDTKYTLFSKFPKERNLRALTLVIKADHGTGVAFQILSPGKQLF